MKPRIGLINTWAFLDEHAACILAAGGVPFFIPVGVGPDLAKIYIDSIDGLIVPGGEDVTPFLYGEEPAPQVQCIKRGKDNLELALIAEARKQNKPIFGVCRGQQLLNVALGGTLIQDVPTQGGKISHRQLDEITTELIHSVTVQEGTYLYEMFGKTRLEVNSYHHQAIKDVAPGLRVSGVAADGIIEAVESEDGRIFAVQWHPECLCKDYPEFLALYHRLIALC